MMKDSLGDRMKKYEDINRNNLLPRSNVIIRLDGKAFHTYTRGCKKPFDGDLQQRLVKAAIELCKQISGFKCAYLQSDEISILINDLNTIQTQGRFDYNINKINSVSSSILTAYFNKGQDKLAMFDCRCFNIPEKDIANYFLWRAKDWKRNSIQMLARSIFSQKELNGKKQQDMFDMCYKEGIDWDDLEGRWKNGTYIFKEDIGFYENCDIRADYESISSNIIPILATPTE